MFSFVSFLLGRPRAITEFGRFPARFDSKVVTVIGRVERVLQRRRRHGLQKFLSALTKLFSRRPDEPGHTRFLLSSPQLIGGRALLIIHNDKFGALPAKRGQWVEVQGVYLHRNAGKRQNFLSRMLPNYGKLHYTHAPKGYVTVLTPKEARDELKRRSMKKER